MNPKESNLSPLMRLRLHHAARVYKTILKQGKESWWRENGLKTSYYRKFIGEKNFKELIEDIKTLQNTAERLIND